MLQKRPDTFARTNLSFSLFACNDAADHTFRVARDSGTFPKPLRTTALFAKPICTRLECG
jgi:hypothetical protein